jgi:hypothetical protein
VSDAARCPAETGAEHAVSRIRVGPGAVQVRAALRDLLRACAQPCEPSLREHAPGRSWVPARRRSAVPVRGGRRTSCTAPPGVGTVKSAHGSRATSRRSTSSSSMDPRSTPSARCCEAARPRARRAIGSHPRTETRLPVARRRPATGHGEARRPRPGSRRAATPGRRTCARGRGAGRDASLPHDGRKHGGGIQGGIGMLVRLRVTANSTSEEDRKKGEKCARRGHATSFPRRSKLTSAAGLRLAGHPWTTPSRKLGLQWVRPGIPGPRRRVVLVTAHSGGSVPDSHRLPEHRGRESNTVREAHLGVKGEIG